MGTLRRFADNLAKRFGRKTQNQPKSVTYETKAPLPKKEAEDKVKDAYNTYAGRMRKRGLRAKTFRKWVKEGHTAHQVGFGTFRSVKSLSRRTDVSSSGDIHRERVAGERPSRASWRHMMRIAERAKSKQPQGVNP